MDINKLNRAIAVFREKQAQIDELKASQDKARAYISKYVMKYGSTKTDDATCSCVTRRKTEYDIKGIKKKLPREQYIKFIDDEITVDAEKLLDYFRENDIDSVDFMKFCNPDRVVQVNEKKLAELCESGEINFEDLQGCYKIEESKTVSIRLK